MPREPEEKDLLVDFEMKNLPDDYREYFKLKRNNFFASIHNYPEHWKLFCMIDQLWKRELTDLEFGISAETGFPIVLYINAHSKIRISTELAFSMCMQEARSVLRDAIESVAHAHHMLRDPANLKAWLGKDDPGGHIAFKKAFLDNKATTLFKGIEELHEQFGELSETGSHPTLRSLFDKMTWQETPSSMGMAVSYTGAPNEQNFDLELFTRLHVCYLMEEALFKDCEDRLRLDPQLGEMRRDVERFGASLQRKLINKYTVKAPAKKPTKT